VKRTVVLITKSAVPNKFMMISQQGDFDIPCRVNVWSVSVVNIRRLGQIAALPKLD
jgi:hypothetical protein